MLRLRPMPTASLADMTLKPVRGLLKRVACSGMVQDSIQYAPRASSLCQVHCI